MKQKYFTNIYCKKPSREPNTFKNYGVFDIEARDWINFLGLVAYSEHPYTLEIFSNKNKKRSKDYIEWMFSEDNTINLWFAHFGGSYDFLFLLKDIGYFQDIFIEDMVMLGSSFLSFSLCKYDTVSFKDYEKSKRRKKKVGKNTFMVLDRKIDFKDSGKMLPFSLKNLAINFDVVHKKLDEDASNLTEWTPEVEKYCVYDCKALYEVLDKYFNNELIQASGVKYTTASQSMAYFKTTLGEIEIPSLNDEIDEFVRESYFGGRTEIYKPVFDGDENNFLNYYDINSLYPSVMIDNHYGYYPSKKNIKDINDDYISFFDCDVYVPEDLFIGPLPTKTIVNKMTKTIFPVGTFRGKWSCIELKNAMQYGVKILKIHKAKSFHKGEKIFFTAIDSLYKRRLKSSKNSVDDILSKLLMNSLYGKFGINRNKENLFLWCPELFPDKYADYEIETALGSLMLVKDEVYLDKTFSNVAIAAQVTSYARVRHYNDMMKLKDVYSVDTDSYFTTDTVETGTGLGGVKLEDKIQRACFLLPKTYAMDIVTDLEKKTDTKTIIKMKGFAKEVREKFTYDDFVAALHGDMIRLKGETRRAIMKPRAAMSRGDFLKIMEKSTKQIRSMYDKRRLIYSKSGEITTKPLVLKNNEIIAQ